MRVLGCRGMERAPCRKQISSGNTPRRRYSRPPPPKPMRTGRVCSNLRGPGRKRHYWSEHPQSIVTARTRPAPRRPRCHQRPRLDAKKFKTIRSEICNAAPDSRRRTTVNRGRDRPQNTRASRRAGRSGYCENDAATGKEYFQNRRVRRPYRLINWAGPCPCRLRADGRVESVQNCSPDTGC